jgi:uncharacterized protein (TIGR03086 family)
LASTDAHDETTPGPIADRWHRVAGDFAEVIDAVPDDRWDAPAPCTGWVARDVVDHLVSWVPGFLEAGAGLPLPDTAGRELPDAWSAIAAAIQRALDDPATAASTFDHPQAGSHLFGDAVDRFICSDVLVHTWDLATAVGRPVELDPEAVAMYVAGYEAVDEDLLVQSGHFGPRVTVAPDASPQTRLLALTGRSVENWQVG